MEDEEVSVYKQVSSWETDDVIRWMNGLHKSLEDHIPQFLAHCICGADLLKMSHQQLEYLKVTQIGHQELLLEAVELLSALEKGCTHDFTFSLASNLSKRTSQLINSLNSSSRKKSRESSEDQEAKALLSRVETTSGIMMAAKLLLSWLDRNPSNLLEDYEGFRTEILRSALDLTGMLVEGYDTAQMLETCRVILKCTAVMMCPENLSSIQPIKLYTAKLQPREDSGLGFSIQRTRQGNLVVSSVIPGSPAHRSGKIFPGVEIVQINNQNVVGWEMRKVVETLKASGHEVTLIINAGTSERAKKVTAEDSPDSHTTRPVQNGAGDDTLKLNATEDEHSDSSHLATNQSSGEPLSSISQSTTHSDGLSSSQGTLDDITGSPASFEGDTDFSGMHNVLLHGPLDPHGPLDLQRTSSAPLIDQRKVTDLSSDSYPSSAGPVDGKEGGSLCSADSTSLEGVDGGSVGGGEEGKRKKRTASDGTPKKQAKNPKHHLPPVAYRTQVIGGVIVRVPIKPDEQDKANQKKGSRHKVRGRHKGSGHGSGGTKGAGGEAASEGGKHKGSAEGTGGEGPQEGGKIKSPVRVAGGEGLQEVGKVLVKGRSLGDIPVSSSPVEPHPASQRPPSTGAVEEAGIGVEDQEKQGKAVFSECKEVIIGGHTAKQVTVSSSTEIVGGGKKSANPALMVPCFQLKNADKEGFMCKLGGSGLTPKNWRRRWFVLKDKKLYYYKTAFDVSALGIVDMVGYTMEHSPESKKKYAFRAVRQGARTYSFQAESLEDMNSWMECLKEAAEPDDQHNLTDTPTTIEASDDEL